MASSNDKNNNKSRVTPSKLPTDPAKLPYLKQKQSTEADQIAYNKSHVKSIFDRESKMDNPDEIS